MLAIALAVILTAMPGHINIGVRHVLLVYLPLATFAGIVCDRVLSDAHLATIGCMVVLITWCTVSVLHVHPDYISYMNELAGQHPENILADSDLDWEQGYSRLNKRLQQLGVQHFTFNPNTAGYMIAGNPFPPYEYMTAGRTPPHGWSAVAITPWRLFGRPEWPARYKPREVVAHSILLYWFP
jgi:hypothetical protein